MEANCIANRCLILALCDLLPVDAKVVLDQRLLALVSGGVIPGVESKTTMATDVRKELDSVIRVLERGTLADLGR